MGTHRHLILKTLSLAYCICLISSLSYGQQPYAIGSFPNNGAYELFCNTFISVNINFPGEGRQIDVFTLHSGNVKLYPDGQPDLQVSAEISYDPDFQYLTLQPKSLLMPRTTYLFEITSDVKDERGSSFQHFYLRFTTGDCRENGFGDQKNGTPKPLLSLTNFDARLINNEVAFTFVTTKEFMQLDYSIAHSFDKQAFTEVTSVMSEGDSESPVQYNLRDKYPEFGTNHYLFEARDIYGKVTYSDTITFFREFVRFASDEIEKNGELAVLTNVAPQTAMGFVLRSKDGKDVLRKAGTLPHLQEYFEISLRDIEPGKYEAILLTPQTRLQSEILIIDPTLYGEGRSNK